jgi:hypothetical protein
MKSDFVISESDFVHRNLITIHGLQLLVCFRLKTSVHSIYFLESDFGLRNLILFRILYAWLFD